LFTLESHSPSYGAGIVFVVVVIVLIIIGII
jgi:hypothetical protein